MSQQNKLAPRPKLKPKQQHDQKNMNCPKCRHELTLRLEASNMRAGFRTYECTCNQHESCKLFLLFWSNSPLSLGLAVRPSSPIADQREDSRKNPKKRRKRLTNQDEDRTTEKTTHKKMSKQTLSTRIPLP
jgi:hypothetical protein